MFHRQSEQIPLSLTPRLVIRSSCGTYLPRAESQVF